VSGPARSGRCILASAAVALALLAPFPGSAGAAVVTVGSPLTAPFVPGSAGFAFTSMNPGAGSPVTGTVISWQVLLGAGGPFKLRVLQPNGGNSFTGVATSTPQVPAGPGLQTFPTSLPIKTGQTIGLDNSTEDDELGIAPAPGRPLLGVTPPVPDGIPTEFEPGAELELAFNAQVLPAPTVASLSKKSGSIKGGTKVAIVGTDLGRAGSVSFGSAPAKGFTIDSDTQVTAVTPAAKSTKPVAVSITTPAGTAAAADQFSYEACKVPKLGGKSLKKTKKLLRKGHCKLGKVNKRGDATAKTGKVVKQGAKPKKLLAPGAKVNVTLG
jgi:hypothetical protein